ncbi:hypothetical protein TYRP_009202 [Tyrophagus putrescentiae]|nr:hypothetical protein TYRP_009202 [Tyrophagus putrescentiae]
MKMNAVSKVGPRTPKPRPRDSSGGGVGGKDTQETLVTSTCRPSVFFEQIREKLAKENPPTNTTKKAKKK